jgi:hypothetical protein
LLGGSECFIGGGGSGFASGRISPAAKAGNDRRRLCRAASCGLRGRLPIACSLVEIRCSLMIRFGHHDDGRVDGSSPLYRASPDGCTGIT